MEEDAEDLTDSARMACRTLDTLGDPDIDCCISGEDTVSYGNRDKFVCLGRTAATLLGMTTGTSCQKCPTGVIGRTANNLSKQAIEKIKNQ